MIMSASGLRKHSVSIRGHATSYTLEDAFYEIIETIARQESISVASLVARIDAQRDRGNNLSSALRLHALNWVRRDRISQADKSDSI